MNRHLYLRAYMAGIVVPTIFLLVVMTGYCILRYVYNFPIPVERVIVFPMAVVPNLFFVALRSNSRLSIGTHGAILPVLLAPLGFLLARTLDFPIPNFAAHAFPVAAPIVLLVYYFVWKYLVGSLNRTQEIV
jgi:hypothetical protein